MCLSRSCWSSSGKDWQVQGFERCSLQAALDQGMQPAYESSRRYSKGFAGECSRKFRFDMEISGNIMLWLAFCPRMFNQMRDPSMRSSTRSEEHTSELQSLMRMSSAVFSLTKKSLQTGAKALHKSE